MAQTAKSTMRQVLSAGRFSDCLECVAGIPTLKTQSLTTRIEIRS
jgi:hypothetical protein